MTPAKRTLSEKPKAVASGVRAAEAVALCSALYAEPQRRRAECCSSPSSSLFYDECVRHLSAALEAGRVRVHSAAVAQCDAAARKRFAGCDWVAPTAAAPPAECRGVVVGLVKAGGSCRSSLECEGALHCEGQGATSAGVCRAPQPISAACGVGVDPLATYLSERNLELRKPSCADHCSLVTHRCEPRPEPGAACRASVNCASDQRCADGRCEARTAGSEGDAGRATAGETCRTDLDCALGGCVASTDGRRVCGMKCESSLGSIRIAAGSQALPISNGASQSR